MKSRTREALCSARRQNGVNHMNILNILALLFVPSIALLLILAPLFPVLRGRMTGTKARRRVVANLSVFVVVCLLGIIIPLSKVSLAAEAAAAEPAVLSIVGTNAQALGFLAAGLVTGLACIGSGIAVAAAAPAAIGAVSENAGSFGKAIIFVVLGEGIAIYGLLISILIINRL
jgi:V/A-type H+-transporting ATPase subunit K